MGNATKSEKKRLPLRYLALILVLLTLSLGGIGYTAAKYVRQQQREAQIHAANFHFSSDYLRYDANPEYTVSTGAVEFYIYNSEVENTALHSATDITYTIEVGEGWQISDVKNEDGIEQGAVDNCFILPSAGQWHKVTLRCTVPDPAPVQVTVTSTAPYEKELTAKFQYAVPSAPDYQVEDQGGYVLLTLHSNRFSGALSVSWPEGLVPDTLTPGMETWTGTSGKLTVAPNTTYTLVFLEHTAGTYTKAADAGTVGIIKSN